MTIGPNPYMLPQTTTTVVRGCFSPADQTIYLLEPPDHPLAYNVALHELGHAYYNDTRYDDTPLDIVMRQECRAWQYALVHTLAWDQPTHNLLVSSFEVYSRLYVGQYVSEEVERWIAFLVQESQRRIGV